MSMHPKSIAILTLVALTQLSGCAKESPESMVQSAKESIQASDYKAAIVELKGALQLAPNNITARLLLGEALQVQEQWENSEKELRKALSLGASSELVLPKLAHALVVQGKFQEAIDLKEPSYGMKSEALAAMLAERAVAYMGLKNQEQAVLTIAEGEKILARAGEGNSSKELSLAKAQLALLNKKTTDAVSILDAALRQNPKFLDALSLKAQLLLMANNDIAALNIYQQILAIDKNQLRGQLAIAGIYQKAGNLEAADKALQVAENISRNSPLVLFSRATIDLSLGKIKIANAAIQQVLRNTPDHLPSLLLEATTSYELGNYEKSRKNAEYVLTQIPGSISAARILAASQLKLSDPQGALATLHPFLKTHDNDAITLSMIGDAMLQTHDYANAMAYLDRAAKLEPQNPSFKSQQAAAHLAQGELDQAISAIEKAATLSVKPGQADMVLIMLQLKKPDYDQALKSITALENKLPNNPIPHNLRAAAYLGQNNVGLARQSLEKAIAIDPKFFPAAANLARLDVQDKNLQAAQSRFEAVLAADKNNVSAMLGLAELAAVGKQDKKQLNWLEKAVKADAKSIQPRKQLIAYYLAKKEYTNALAHAKDLVNQNPQSVAALDILGATQLVSHDNNAAIATFTQLAEKTQASPAALYHLALAEIAAKDVHAARANLQKALMLKADFVQAYDSLIQIEMAAGKPDAALLFARQMQAQQPISVLGFDREADIQLSLKRYALAINAYQRSIDLGAGAAGLAKLHHGLILSGDSKAAEQRLNAWIKLHPTDQVARDYAASYYMSAGRTRDAIVQYETILKATPNNAITMNNLATLYHQEKDGRAQAMAEQALKLRSDEPNIMDTLGWILVEKGDLSRSVGLLGSAVSLAPKAGGIRYHYAVALARAGKKTEARKELATAISVGGQFPELENAKTLLKEL